MRYDWNRYGNPGAAMFARVMTWVLAVLAVAAWLLFLLAGDWVLIIVPLLATAGAAVNPLAVRRHYGVREPSGAERLAAAGRQLAAGPVINGSEAKFIPRGAGRDTLRKSIVLPPAWDVSVTLNWGGYSGPGHLEVCERKPGPGADGVIRLIPRHASPPPWSSGPVMVHSWTVIARAASQAEGMRLLAEAGPLLRERLADLADAGRGCRYFRLEGGRLAEVANWPQERPSRRDGSFPVATREEAGRADAAPGTALSPLMADLALGPCAHKNAEPVDLLVTGERVAWCCPDCPAELPAGWR